MILIIPTIFVIALVIQILYLVGILSRFNVEKTAELPMQAPSQLVSVVVCAQNEIENLKELMPILLGQQYANLEIVIVNDRSTDGTDVFLENLQENHSHVKVVTIKETPEHITGKKYALSLGIKVANSDFILLTDADCRPTSEYWVWGMASSLSRSSELVLGFSPYAKNAGFLNGFIRFETFFTAWQYLAFALIGRPYMGVGRNLLYKKQLFLDNLGFRNHQRIVGGDDDLFVNQNANKFNTKVCFHKDAQTVSLPKTTWAEWFTQKQRHLAIGKFYKQSDKFFLGLYAISHLLFWLASPGMFLVKTAFVHFVLAGGFLLRILLFWLFGGLSSAKLNKPIAWYSLPFYDVVLALYYLFMGWNSILNIKVKKWK